MFNYIYFLLSREIASLGMGEIPTLGSKKTPFKKMGFDTYFVNASCIYLIFVVWTAFNRF